MSVSFAGGCPIERAPLSVSAAKGPAFLRILGEERLKSVAEILNAAGWNSVVPA